MTFPSTTAYNHHPVQPSLAEHAAEIKRLGKRVVGDIIEIGRHLAEAKEIAGRANWVLWLTKEFGWTERTARNFMQVYEQTNKSAKFADLSLPLTGLYLLAAPSTSDKARGEVIRRAERGERLSLVDVKRTIAKHNPAKPEVGVTDSGSVSAQDQLRSVPPEKWRDLMFARREHMETRLGHECRRLIEFVNDAKLMYKTLGFSSAEDMVRDGYGLEPAEIAIAVEWLRLNPSEHNPPLDPTLAEKLNPHTIRTGRGWKRRREPHIRKGSFAMMHKPHSR